MWQAFFRTLIIIILVLVGGLIWLFGDEIVARIHQYGTVNQIESHFNKGENKAAMTLLEESSKKWPNEPIFHLKRATIYHRVKRYDKAKEAYELGLKQSPHADRARENYARLLMQMRKPNDAIFMYRSVLNDRPHNVHALIGLGEIYRLAGKRADDLGFKQERYPLWNWARYYYSLGLKENDAALKAWYGLGEILEGDGQYAAASASYCQVIKREPSIESAWFNLGLSQWYLGRPDRGMALMNWATQTRDDKQGEAYEAEARTIYSLRQSYYLKHMKHLELKHINDDQWQALIKIPAYERTDAHYPDIVLESCHDWQRPELNTDRPEATTMVDDRLMNDGDPRK